MVFIKPCGGRGGRGGGEYNSISLHFGKFQKYVFFLFQSLDVRAAESLSAS